MFLLSRQVVQCCFVFVYKVAHVANDISSLLYVQGTVNSHELMIDNYMYQYIDICYGVAKLMTKIQNHIFLNLTENGIVYVQGTRLLYRYRYRSHDVFKFQMTLLYFLAVTAFARVLFSLEMSLNFISSC